MSKCGIRSLFTTFTSKYDIAILLGLILYLADIISDLAVFGQLLYEEKYSEATISIVLIITPNFLFAFFCILDKEDGVIDACKNFLVGLVTLQVMCPNTPSTKIVSVGNQTRPALELVRRPATKRESGINVRLLGLGESE